MNKDNINSAMKRLSKNIENGLLPLNDTLTFNTFSQSSIHICMVLANFAKKLCVESNQTGSLEAFLAIRLNFFRQKPWTPTYQCWWSHQKNYRLSSSSYIERGHYQICWKSTCVYRHPVCESGCEAAIYSMSQFFNEDDSEAVLSIDASNDFNAVNC